MYEGVDQGSAIKPWNHAITHVFRTINPVNRGINFSVIAIILQKFLAT
ncbi:hypothetical protein JOC74_003301 [Bacillus capparidis]|uniref:Uncharacterized protein n=1 Tax=Bacillus capparidis TaxID=1840411 RepID=A0ABS4CZH1_9BACI|nr:hypothetical protein [Bacillus capparidis]